MALDTRYIPAFAFQELLVDKITGSPLAGGIITFYKDQARTQYKPIYQITGSTPNYTYTALPNPIMLSSVGTFQDGSGNDIIPYFYPYDASGAVELYYVTVYSSSGTLQFTRSGIPNTAESSDEAIEETNYVPNGQFLIHNTFLADSTHLEGEIRQAVTDVAPGGWTFERTATSTATDTVTFYRHASPSSTPDAYPRYSCEVACTSVGTSTTDKGLRLKFRDVNKFASSTQKYTLAFTAESASGSAADVNVNLIKNFGTGGSPQIVTPLVTVTIPIATTVYNHSFVFGDNSGVTIGSNDDDFVQISWDFPTNFTHDVRITDVMLTPGEVTINKYPIATSADSLYKSLAGWTNIPNYNLNDLHLPLKLTLSGLAFDDSCIGKIYSAIYELANVGELLCDGSGYETTAFSSDHIPYSRLQTKLWNDTAKIPKFGTAPNYITGIVSATTAGELRVATNITGTAVACTDGTAATGFDFTRIIHASSTTLYYVKSYMVTADRFLVGNLNKGSVTDPNVHTSGFTISRYQIGSSETQQIISVETIAATTLAGKYWTFSSYHSGDVPFYVWYKVNGVGSDPLVVGATAILVELETADTAADVAQKTQEALNGWQITRVLIGAAPSASSYFNAHSTTLDFYVWYTVDGAGADPALLGKKGIEVAILSTDTNAEVAQKTRTAINMFSYAVPDLRGRFLRGWNNGAGIDLDAARRWSLAPGIIGDVIGSMQLSDNLHHRHPVDAYPFTADLTGSAYNIMREQTYETGFSGGSESRPINTYVNYVIKY